MRTRLYPMVSLCGIVAALAAAPVSAQVTQIFNPADYSGITSIIEVPNLADFTNFSSVTDGVLTINSSATLEKRTVPGSWGTWGSPPNTEGDAGTRIGFTSRNSVTFNFSQALNTYGMEVEGNNFSPADFNLEFFNGATSLGSINRNINGNAGARILAGSSVSSFDRVTVTAAPAAGGFAVARFRYNSAPTSLTPEAPGAVQLLAGLLPLGVFMLVKRRKQNASLAG